MLLMRRLLVMLVVVVVGVVMLLVAVVVTADAAAADAAAGGGVAVAVMLLMMQARFGCRCGCKTVHFTWVRVCVCAFYVELKQNRSKTKRVRYNTTVGSAVSCRTEARSLNTICLVLFRVS